MKSTPTKSDYVLGEKLDTTGLAVEVNYDDQSVAEITDYTVSGFDSSKEGECTVTVQWVCSSGTYKTSFKVTVVDPRPKVTAISIDQEPTKLTYQRGEALDLTGMVVKAVYTDNSEKVITDYTVSGYNALKNGVQTVTVSYEGFTDTFVVAVGTTLPTASPAPTATPKPTPSPTSSPMPTTKPSPTPIPGKLGDADGNNIINAQDALMVLQHAANISMLTGEQQKIVDMDNNGVINASDALTILQIAAGIL